MIMDRTSSLLSRHSWKLYVGLALVLAGGILVLGSNALRSLANVPWVGACGAVSASLGLTCLMLLPTCPSCHLRLFPHAISTQPVSGWLKWLLSNSRCPRCGFSHEP